MHMYPWSLSAHSSSSGTPCQSQLLLGGGGGEVLASHALNHMSWSSQAQLTEDREALTWRLLFPLEQPRCSDQKLCQAAGHSQECAVGKQDPFQIWPGTEDEEMQKVDPGCIHETPGAG